MKRKIRNLSQWALPIVLALSLFGPMQSAAANSSLTTVVPNIYESAEAPSNSGWPFSASPARYQQVFSASEMGGSGIIDKIAFRLDQMVASGFTDVPVDLEVRLSHVLYDPDDAAFTNTFDTNIGSEETLVLDGVFNLSGTISAVKPNPFDIILDVDNTFMYNGNDNLLMDIKIFSQQPNNGYSIYTFDATGYDYEDSVSRLYFADAEATTGYRSTIGLVTEFTISTFNVAPTITTLSVSPNPIAVDTDITASATFTDPDVDDTHTAEWDWGDGTSSSGTVTQVEGGGSVVDTHAYETAGIYKVCLTVTDNGNLSDVKQFQNVIVYDPSASFVTGAGWKFSYAGAYIPDPSLGGTATFAFISKYVKDAQAPNGHINFHFKEGDLNFSSSSFEWLFVDEAGTNAQIKGTGTINGEGEYKFMLWAGDGTYIDGGDAFRIKIWEEDGGEVVIYDNGIHQQVIRGNIIIHNK